MTIGLLKRLARIEGAILVDSRTPAVSRVTLDREGPNLAGPGEDGRPRLILIRRIVDVGPP